MNGILRRKTKHAIEHIKSIKKAGKHKKTVAAEPVRTDLKIFLYGNIAVASIDK